MAEQIPDDEEFYEQKITGKDFSGVTIENREFNSCVFTSCQMAETVFRFCHFRDCIFEQSNLSLAQFEHCRFQNTTFRKTRLVGIDWTKLEWRKKRTAGCFPFSSVQSQLWEFLWMSFEKLYFPGMYAARS